MIEKIKEVDPGEGDGENPQSGTDFAWSWKRSPSRSPNRMFDRVEYSSTQSIRVDLNRSAFPASRDIGVDGIDRRRTAWIVIKHQTANGIQEVVGSIPIGSTIFSKPRFEKIVTAKPKAKPGNPPPRVTGDS